MWTALRNKMALLVVMLAATGNAAPALAQADSLRYEVAVSKYLMGTLVEATVMHHDVNAAHRALLQAFQEIERVEQRMSVHLATSEIARLNREAALAPVRVSAESFGLLQRALAYAARFEGLFDVTVGSLAALWGFNDDAPVTVPEIAALDSVRSLIGFRNLVLNERDTTVFFARSGLHIDLGGIAKGYAIDRAVAILRDQGVDDFLLNAGGDLYASGQRQAGQPWRVGVKHPRDSEALLARLTVHDRAVATSGDYERFEQIEGRRYHHILDPRTGYPARQSRSVTVVASSAEEADVLATYLFILGLAQAPGRNDIARYLGVDADGRLHVDPVLLEEQGLHVLE